MYFSVLLQAGRYVLMLGSLIAIEKVVLLHVAPRSDGHVARDIHANEIHTDFRSAEYRFIMKNALKLDTLRFLSNVILYIMDLLACEVFQCNLVSNHICIVRYFCTKQRFVVDTRVINGQVLNFSIKNITNSGFAEIRQTNYFAGPNSKNSNSHASRVPCRGARRAKLPCYVKKDIGRLSSPSSAQMLGG